jgi:hypothetical protein
VSIEQVFEVLKRNVERTRQLLFAAIPKIAAVPGCACGDALSSGPLRA